MFKNVKGNKGFTLVELIVVMAVLAVISAIAVPRFLGVQDKAKLDADYATGAMIAKAAELYEAKDDSVGTTIPAQELIDKGYLSSVEFKSDTFKNFQLSDITVSYGVGSITVSAPSGEGIDPIKLYPRE